MPKPNATVTSQAKQLRSENGWTIFVFINESYDGYPGKPLWCESDGQHYCASLNIRKECIFSMTDKRFVWRGINFYFMLCCKIESSNYY